MTSWEDDGDDDLDKLLNEAEVDDQPKAKAEEPPKKSDFSAFSANKPKEGQDAKERAFPDDYKQGSGKKPTPQGKDRPAETLGGQVKSDKYMSSFFTGDELQNIKSLNPKQQQRTTPGGGEPSERNVQSSKKTDSKDNWLGLDRDSGGFDSFSGTKKGTRDYEEDFGSTFKNKLSNQPTLQQPKPRFPRDESRERNTGSYEEQISGEFGPSSLGFQKQIPRDEIDFSKMPTKKQPPTSAMADIFSIVNANPLPSKPVAKKPIKSSQRKESVGGGDESRQILHGSTKGTLQVPSHLIDEEELKAMSSGLDSLYKNQLKMTEKSYQEQIQCLEQSHLRKEEHLRLEIEAIHKEFEGRLERLKEIQSKEDGGESKELGKVQSELIGMVSDLSNNLSAQFKELSLSIHQHNPITQQELLPNIETIFVQKILPTLQNIEFTMNKVQLLNAQAHQNESPEKLEMILQKLEQLERKGHLGSNDPQLKGMESRMLEGFTMLGKEQTQLKEAVIKAAVNSLTQVLQSSNEVNGRKRDKLNRQFKELRRDFRKLLFDFETKNGSIHNSQVASESDQKQILQSIRDLHSLVQMGNSQWRNQIQMDDFHSNSKIIQSETELKLLQEERRAMAESLAKISIERQKLNEERMNSERVKIELDMERNRIRDLETELKIRVADAEDMKRRLNESRQEESRLVTEATMKVKEIERERYSVKEHLSAMEQQLRIREHKHFQEKTEFMREKDFLERLRDQMLCPACLKSFPMIRNDGDGQDFSGRGQNTLDRYPSNLGRDNRGISAMENEKRVLEDFSFVLKEDN